jgi:hypothetical protein
MGGLGNQLFQIFTTISYGIRSGRQFIFPYSDFLNIGLTRPTYWTTFLKGLVLYTTKNKEIRFSNKQIENFPTIREPSFEYIEIPFVNIENISLFGYFQSYKYFEKDLSTIYSMIHLTEQKELIREEFFGNSHKNQHTISMHFRLGDYKEKTDYHPILLFEYYRNSLSKIISLRGCRDFNVYYFCEEEDKQYVLNMINRLQEDFPKLGFIRVDNNYPDWQQMLIMSCCNDNIIANSTFSWWGAFFNETAEKIVCYPSVWFGPNKGTTNMNDLFPPTWHKIHI